MSDLTKTLDLSMFGCPVHKTKALAAAEQLATGETVMIKLNNDAVDTVMKHLTANGFQCRSGDPDVLTTTMQVSKND